jgi:hypothetical protein
LLKRVQAWPEEDQEELADVAREIESRRRAFTDCPTKKELRYAREWTLHVVATSCPTTR